MRAVNHIGLMLLLASISCNGFGQGVRITLLEFIQQAEEHYNVQFSYNHKLVTKTEVLPVPFNNNIGQELEQALNGSGISFIHRQNTIDLYPTSASKREEATILGVIIDSQGGETLPNAVIRILNGNRYTVSNRDGAFTIIDPPSDTTEIIVSYLGYSTFETTISAIKENATIKLSAIPEVLDELVVTDSTTDILRVADRPGQLSINARYFNNLTSFGQKDAFRSLQLLPGISGTGESSSNLRIRGSTSDQNLVLFDGFTVYHLDHFFGVFSAFNSQVIKDIQVFKGGFGAEYGGRTSSVVDMIGKNGNRDRVAGQASINLLSADVTLELPINEKVSLVLAGRRSLTDIIRGNLFYKLFDQINTQSDIGTSIDDDELEPNFRFYDLNGKATWRVTNNDLIQLSFYRGNDDLNLEKFFEDDSNDEDFSFEQLFIQNNEWGNRGESLRYVKNWNKRLFSEFRAAHSTFFRNQDYLEETAEFAFGDLFEDEIQFSDRNKIEEFNFSQTNTYDFNPSNRTTIGGFLSDNTISYRSTFFEDVDLSLNSQGLYTGIFINHEFSPDSKTSINPGLRYTFYQITNKNYLEPRFSINHRLFKWMRVKGAFGRYYQFVGRVTTFDNSFGQEDFWLLRGVDDSPVISSTQYIAGATFNFGPIEVDIEAYHKTLDGLSAYTIDSIPITDEDFEIGDLTQGKGSVKGIDVLVKHETNKLVNWISYTHSKSINQFDDIEDNRAFSANFDQPHEIKVVHSFKHKSWNFTASWVYGSGRPYTSRLVNFDDEDIVTGEINSMRLPDYHRLDLNISYLKQLTKLDLRFSLNLLNIYNRSNIRSIFFLEQIEEELDRIVTREEKVKMLGFTPSLGVEISFGKR